MLTPRGIGLIVTSAALWIGARSFGVAELQMASVAAVLLVVAAVGFTWLTSLRLTVDRIVRPSSLFFSRDAVVELTITNTGRLPTTTLEVRDRAPAGLGGPEPTRLAPIRPRRRVTMTYRLHGALRGRFMVGPLEVTVVDPFGLATRRHTIASTTPVTVYPPVWHLSAGIPLGGASGSGGSARRRPSANGEDFAKVRDYVPGDDLRTVHWATTAHRGKLMVRQAESVEDPRAVVLLDRRSSRHAGSGPDASIETAVTAAASVGFHLASRGRSLALLDSPLAASPAALPWETYLERLAGLAATSVEFGELLRQLGRGAAGEGTLIAIVTMPQPSELRELVRAGRNFTAPLALLIDVCSHDSHTGPQRDPHAREAATALRLAGWRVGLLERGTRVDVAWNELLITKHATAGATTSGMKL